MGEWLTELGVAIDVRRPYAGDSLPEDLTGHSGMLVLGGEMGAYDHDGHPWLQAARFAPTVWGVQWHPEAGEEIIGPWAEQDRDDALERGVDVDAYLGHVIAARPRLREAWRVLAERFAVVCRESILVGVNRQ
jgi:GMP synthase-like glutamine amidotransferase